MSGAKQLGDVNHDTPVPKEKLKEAERLFKSTVDELTKLASSGQPIEWSLVVGGNMACGGTLTFQLLTIRNTMVGLLEHHPDLPPDIRAACMTMVSIIQNVVSREEVTQIIDYYTTHSDDKEEGEIQFTGPEGNA